MESVKNLLKKAKVFNISQDTLEDVIDAICAVLSILVALSQVVRELVTSMCIGQIAFFSCMALVGVIFLITVIKDMKDGKH